MLAATEVILQQLLIPREELLDELAEAMADRNDLDVGWHQFAEEATVSRRILARADDVTDAMPELEWINRRTRISGETLEDAVHRVQAMIDAGRLVVVREEAL
jgi:hypothetical protein